MLCALTLAANGCASSGAGTSVPPAPATPGALLTDGWCWRDGESLRAESGQWLHLPAAEAGELLLWIETMEAR